jgi:DNA replicative helicase MCM subunit Mcm2 (Cdc46/Mcm family)
MIKENLVCEECGSIYSLEYDDEDVNYSPSHCPFCGEFIWESNEGDLKEETDEDEDQNDLDLDYEDR